MNELISVIIPVYNVKEYLERCLESVISQSYENLEIILVDDGSTDGSSELCDDIAKRDSRIFAFHKTNGGLSDARNYGITQSNGAYISFVDSDDWIAPTMIEDLFDAIQKYNVRLAVCETAYAYDDYNYLPKTTGNAFVLDKLPAYEMLLKNRRFRTNAWNKLYSADLWDGVQFPKGKKYEDVYIMHRIYDMCDRIAYVDKALYYYYQRNNSIVHIPDISADYDLLDGTLVRFEYLKKYSELDVLCNASVVSAALSLYKNCGLHQTKLTLEDFSKLNNEIDLHMRNIKIRNLAPRIRIDYVLYRISPKVMMKVEPIVETTYQHLRRN